MILIIIFITLLANAADLLLKLGANEAGASLDDPLAIFGTPWVWLGAVLGIAAMVAWVYVLGRHHISHAYPVFVGLGFLNITLISWLFLHEEVSLRRVLGTVFILAGIVVVHLMSQRQKSATGERPKAGDPVGGPTAATAVNDPSEPADTTRGGFL